MSSEHKCIICNTNPVEYGVNKYPVCDECLAELKKKTQQDEE